MEPATRKGLHARPTFEISETNWNTPNRAHPGLAAVFDLPAQLQPFQVGRVEVVAPPREGAWRGGDVVWNRLARGSDGAQPPGWLCVRGGSPGVWKNVTL